MFTRYLVAALALAAPASAATQLELGLRVPAGAYTTSQLAELSAASSDNNRLRIGYLTSGRAGPRDAAAAGRISRASDRQVIETSLDEHDANRARFITNGGARREGINTDAYKARLAADVGVDGNAYSLSQLYNLADERDN